MIDEKKCRDGRRHYWEWHERSFELSSRIGDIQECRRCGQARLINEQGDDKYHGESVDALIVKCEASRKAGRRKKKGGKS